MREAQDPVLEAVRAGGLLPEGEPLVVMLSGGRDSVCLLDVAARLAGAASVFALHVDYGLRGAASDADERHCASLCERLGIVLERVRAGAPPEPGNLQAWARELRYAAAERLRERRGAAAIAAGHTATDQAETVLYRLASSPGRRALLGMRAREGAIVRPLLNVTREQTAAYCERRGLGWRDDASNESSAYARGRVRANLMPALRAIHPAAEANVVRTAALLRDEAAVLDELVAERLRPHGGDRIPLAELRALPGALRRLVVQRLADDAAARLVPGAARRADEIAALSGGERGSAALDIGGGVRATVRAGVVRIELLRGGDGS